MTKLSSKIGPPLARFARASILLDDLYNCLDGAEEQIIELGLGSIFAGGRPSHAVLGLRDHLGAVRYAFQKELAKR